jgi:hypothetical protein
VSSRITTGQAIRRIVDSPIHMLRHKTALACTTVMLEHDLRSVFCFFDLPSVFYRRLSFAGRLTCAAGSSTTIFCQPKGFAGGKESPPGFVALLTAMS